MPGVALVDGEAGGVVVIASRNLPTTSSSSPAPSLAVIAASPMWPTSIDRCLIAHFLADLPEDERDELKWDERALAAVDGVSDARAREFDPRLQVRGFLPSLYASLADDHRRLGDADRARDFLGKARATSDALGDDAHGDLVRSILDKMDQALTEGSTEQLPNCWRRVSD